eukprot:2450796-Amphidinium_carterae.2
MSCDCLENVLWRIRPGAMTPRQGYKPMNYSGALTTTVRSETNSLKVSVKPKWALACRKQNGDRP